MTQKVCCHQSSTLTDHCAQGHLMSPQKSHDLSRCIHHGVSANWPFPVKTRTLIQLQWFCLFNLHHLFILNFGGLGWDSGFATICDFSYFHSCHLLHLLAAQVYLWYVNLTSPVRVISFPISLSSCRQFHYEVPMKWLRNSHIVVLLVTRDNYTLTALLASNLTTDNLL